MRIDKLQALALGMVLKLIRW